MRPETSATPAIRLGLASLFRDDMVSMGFIITHILAGKNHPRRMT
jgi:hypothetical protein